MRRPRHLSPQERELWNMVAGRTTPLDPAKPAEIPLTPPPKTPAARAPDMPPLPDFMIGEKADAARPHNLMPTIGQSLRQAPVQMDHKSYGKMTRGKLKPEQRIDLHGMTVAEAHPELTYFILNAVASGKRLVLVITGKGKNRDDGSPIPVRHGVLRHQVPQWLSLPPLRSVVLQVTPAHMRHGGDGAYYVYLRRAR